MPERVVVYDTPEESIAYFRVLTLKGRLKLEIQGIRFKVPTAPAIRELIGSTTRNRTKLLEEFEEWIAEKYPVPMVD